MKRREFITLLGSVSDPVHRLLMICEWYSFSVDRTLLQLAAAESSVFCQPWSRRL